MNRGQIFPHREETGLGGGEVLEQICDEKSLTTGLDRAALFSTDQDVMIQEAAVSTGSLSQSCPHHK